MKKITLLIITYLSICNTLHSQCNKIKVTDDEMKGTKTISSPYSSPASLLTGIPKKGGSMHITKVVKSNISTSIISFSGVGGISLTGSHGLYIKFASGEIERFEDYEIRSSYISNGQYMYSASLILDDENSNIFRESEIVQFDLSLYKFKVKEKDSKEFKAYINCVLDNN